MHVIWPYERLLEQSHFELFSQTLIPSFRPFLHLEKFFGDLLGFKGIHIINQVAYATFVWLIADQLRKAMPCQQLRQGRPVSGLILLLPYTVLPFYFAIAGARTIADPMYAYGIILMILFLMFLQRKRNGAIFEGITTAKQYAWAASSIILVDLSRPYGIFVVAVFAISVIWIVGKRLRNLKIFTRIVALFGGCLLLLTPYHANQLRYTGSVVLSNWGGCNLVEVFPFQSARKHVPEWESKASQDQFKSASMCKDAQAEVISSIRQHSLKAISYLLRPKRFVQLLGPWGVFQYGSVKNLIWTIPFFSGPIIFSWFAYFLFSRRQWSITFLASSLLSWIPMVFSFISHSGAEAAGVLMGFYLPLYFLVLIGLNERVALKKATPCLDSIKNTTLT